MRFYRRARGLPDLVADLHLETQHEGDHTVHIYHESDVLARRRTAIREERWRRVRRIGRGGSSYVWLEELVNPEGSTGGESSFNEPSQSPAMVRALKVVPILTASEHGRIDFGNELLAAAKFSHQRYNRWFVKSYGWFESDENLHIAMEHISLGSLESHLRRSQRPLGEAEARQISLQLLEGLLHMHDNGFAHRDMKPSNILVIAGPPYDNWWVKIADFGITKRYEDATGITSTATSRGTWGFFAPEILGFSAEDIIDDTASASDVDTSTTGETTTRSLTDKNSAKNLRAFAADMWSFGETIVRMLTRTPTFPALIDLHHYLQASNRKAHVTALLRARSPEISDDAINFILALMEPRPGDRPQAADALLLPWTLELPEVDLQSCSPVEQEGLGRIDLDYPSQGTTDETVSAVKTPSGSWTTKSAPHRELVPELARNPSSATERSPSTEITTISDANSDDAGPKAERPPDRPGPPEPTEVAEESKPMPSSDPIATMSVSGRNLDSQPSSYFTSDNPALDIYATILFIIYLFLILLRFILQLFKLLLRFIPHLFKFFVFLPFSPNHPPSRPHPIYRGILYSIRFTFYVLFLIGGIEIINGRPHLDGPGRAKQANNHANGIEGMIVFLLVAHGFSLLVQAGFWFAKRPDRLSLRPLSWTLAGATVLAIFGKFILPLACQLLATTESPAVSLPLDYVLVNLTLDLVLYIPAMLGSDVAVIFRKR